MGFSRQLLIRYLCCRFRGSVARQVRRPRLPAGYEFIDNARCRSCVGALYANTKSTSEEGEQWNPTDYPYHLTRRARGLPLWFSLAVNGVDAYREAIEVAVRLAKQSAELIIQTPHLELIREPDPGVVLFRRTGWQRADYDTWAQALHDEEIAFMAPTKWEGETVGRFALLHPHTSMDLVREILDRTK